jgi:hypothetical protein
MIFKGKCATAVAIKKESPGTKGVMPGLRSVPATLHSSLS